MHVNVFQKYEGLYRTVHTLNIVYRQMALRFKLPMPTSGVCIGLRMLVAGVVFKSLFTVVPTTACMWQVILIGASSRLCTERGGRGVQAYNRIG